MIEHPASVEVVVEVGPGPSAALNKVEVEADEIGGGSLRWISMLSRVAVESMELKVDNEHVCGWVGMG